jgi:hypothetical protein
MKPNDAPHSDDPSPDPAVVDVPTPSSRSTRDLVLIGLHIAFALFLLLLSFILHGRIPGYSAEESAALGFLLFFGLGLPLVLIAIAICSASVFAGGRYLGVLAVSMLGTFVFSVLNVWTGIAASLAYLAFAVWTLRRPTEVPR